MSAKEGEIRSYTNASTSKVSLTGDDEPPFVRLLDHSEES
jgi:hypothetical protein